MRATDFVSVVIPTYNRGYCIAEAVESALNQTHPKLEIIVVDDGSSDDTEAVLSAYLDRIRYIKQCNAGVSAARNLGLTLAEGSWIAFLDSDDLWNPRKLELQLRAVESDSVALVASDHVLVNGDVRKLWSDLRPGGQRYKQKVVEDRPVVSIVRDQIFPSCLLVNRHLLGDLCFDENMSFSEDIHFQARLALRGGLVVIPDCTTEIITRNQANSDSLSHQAETDAVLVSMARIKIVDDLIASDYEFSAIENRFLIRYKGGAFYLSGLALKKRGEWRAALRQFFMSIRTDASVRNFVKITSAVLLNLDNSSRLLGGQSGFLRSDVD